MSAVTIAKMIQLQESQPISLPVDFLEILRPKDVEETIAVMILAPSTKIIRIIPTKSPEVVKLAIINVGFDRRKHDIKVIGSNLILEQDKVLLGEEVFFLGYPLGMIEENDITPFVRKGIVSRRLKTQNKLIIDGYSTGGSSGSPIFLKPQYFSPEGGLTVGKFSRPPHFIGMIHAHIIHPLDPSESENTNLAYAITSDRILSALKTLEP